ncbi:MAG: Nif3-like dinuclear metal center hexameric protein [Lachnospiraceae bacterium]|nr:Nif3-like dinuclear metal center hexameric protein [Lachnospiraceae bacterium]
MKCKEVIKCLELLVPPHLAESWDNVGLLVGDAEKEIRKIMLALDPSEDVISQAIEVGADLLITHHPLIFSGMKSVTTESYVGKRVCRLMRHDIACYTMHTNFDATGMAKTVADLLHLKECRPLEPVSEDGKADLGIGRIGELDVAITLKEFACHVKEVFRLPDVRVFGEADRLIRCVALVPGSGKEYAKCAMEQGAEVLITGDVGHHHGQDAAAQGMAVMDAGHYGLEKVFSSHMEEVLRRELPQTEIIKAQEKEPFWVI